MPDIGLEQAGLGTFLKQNNLFVPPNQREYAWTDEEVMQLFQANLATEFYAKVRANLKEKGLAL